MMARRRDYPMCGNCPHFIPTQLDWGKCYWKDAIKIKRDIPATVSKFSERCLDQQLRDGRFSK